MTSIIHQWKFISQYAPYSAMFGPLYTTLWVNVAINERLFMKMHTQLIYKWKACAYMRGILTISVVF